MTRALRVFFFFLTIFLIWSIYRMFVILPEMVDEFVAKPLLWLAPLFLFEGVHSFHDFVRFGFHRTRLAEGILAGIGVGVLLSFVRIASLYLSTGYLGVSPYDFFSVTLIKHALISFATAVTEEIFFRGYLLQQLYYILGKEWRANILTTIFFIIIHLPLIFFTLKYSLIDALVYSLIIGLVSVVSGMLFFRFKGLAAPVAFHTIWNLFSVIFH